jgi:hypothetical protein
MTPGEGDERAEAILANPMKVPGGGRHNGMLSLMYYHASQGWTNHELLVEAQEFGKLWGKYPGDNLFQDWTALLNMIKAVRTKYPTSAYARANGSQDSTTV